MEHGQQFAALFPPYHQFISRECILNAWILDVMLLFLDDTDNDHH